MKNRSLNILRYGLPALLMLGISKVILSCGSTIDDLPNYAHIAGKIINPTTDHVVIKHHGMVLDTVYLDEQNSFIYKIQNAEKGLYLIQHKPEIQNIYISPGDSLLLRVNTLAFDESLHFSGRGHERNNFMADMFLQDENNSDLLLDFHKYKPEIFLQKSDSIKQVRLKQLKNTAAKKDFPQDFRELAQNIIMYENNDLKERYTYLVNKYYKEYAGEFPPNFHDYREQIDFNSVALQCSPGYKRLLENYLINYSLTWCAGSGLDEADCYDLTNVNNVLARLRKAGELVELPTLREHLLEKIAVRGIVTARNREDILSIIEELQALNMAEEDLDEMKQLGTIQLAYLPGTSLQNVPLLNMAGDYVKIQDVVTKPTVLFLWSVYEKSHREEHELIDQYRRKYPEVDFVGINLDLDEEPAWRVTVRQNSYNSSKEYQLATTNIKKEFFSYFLDKMLLLNAAGEVEVGDIYLTSPEFESQILAFLNA